MSRKKQQKDKLTSYIEDEKRSDEIIEQTMREIFDDLAESEEFQSEKELETSEVAAELNKTMEAERSEEKVEDKSGIKLEDKVQEKEDLLQAYRKKKKKRMIIAGGVTALLVIYLGFAAFFVNHFYFRTTINGSSFSGKTVEDVEVYMKKQVADYVLTLHEREGKSEQISGADIALQYKNGKGLKEALKKQNPLLWITSLFGAKSADVIVEVDYNKESLDGKIAALDVMKEENQIAPVDAQPVYNGERFDIQEETYGSQVNQEKFVETIHTYVAQFKHELDMDKEVCYVMPKFKKDSPEVASARDEMNKYLKASVTYSVEPASEVVDKTLISQWLTTDAEMKVVFSTDAVGGYINELCKKYDTAGTVRSIKTPTGKVAEVSGGGYGWKIDRDAEYAALVDNISAGEVVTREPVYAQKAASHGAADWGSTYLEVDFSTQHMWYIVDGAVVFETDVITGKPIPQRVTPQGVFTILEKMRNKTLKGEIQPDGKPEYETPVEYWLRVTWSGVGFHDATWQSAFGGQLYKTRGSHGCINMPLEKVSQLYGMVNVGCPVIMHY